MVLALLVGYAHFVEAQPAVNAFPAEHDSVAIYSGVYASTFEESIFWPCDVPGIGSGWWLRFNNERDGLFLRYPSNRPGMRTLAHFIRVRGRVSRPGNYGSGFQIREIVVDSVLEIRDTPQTCRSYEELAVPWPLVQSSGARIMGAATTDDRRLVAAMDRAGVISIWNASHGQLVRRFPSGDEADLSSASRVPMAFAHDGTQLAVAGVDGVVRVWNPLEGKRLQTFAATDTLPGSATRAVARSIGVSFNPAGTMLASTVANHTVIWSTATGEQLGAHEAGWNRNFMWINDSSFVAVADSGRFRIYPRLGAAPTASISTGLQYVNRMERSRDGRWLMLRGSGDTIFLWSLTDGKKSARLGIPNQFNTGPAAFSPDGNTLAVAGGPTGLYLWDTRTGSPLRNFLNYPWTMETAWFTADGNSIVTHSTNEEFFRIVHIDPTKALGDVAKVPPVQAAWPAYIDPATQVPGGSLGSIFGFVRHLGTRPIVGAEVSIFDGDKPGSAALAQTTTNTAGHYLLQGVKVRHVIVRVAKPGFATGSSYAHLPREATSTDFELQAQSRE